jgi:hypothetical protein
MNEKDFFSGSWVGLAAGIKRIFYGAISHQPLHDHDLQSPQIHIFFEPWQAHPP